jgi:predicted MFS family arabinose efflux permease
MTAAEEFRRGFGVVVTAAVGLYVSVTHLYSMGVMMQPIEQETGWSRMQISSGLTVVSVVSVMFAPVVGMMIDRWGPRRIAGWGVVVYCCALAGLAASGAALWSWWLAWLCLAAGSVLVKPTVWTAAVANRFALARGMALGLALCGAGLAAAAIPPVTAMLLEALSWRTTYLTLGVCSALVLLPLIYFCFDAGKSTSAPRSVEVAAFSAVLTTIRTRPFICLALSGFFTTVAVTAMVVHFVPALVSKGASRDVAVHAASLIGVCSIIGRLSCGVMLDRFSGRVVGMLAFALPAVCAGVLLFFDGHPARAIGAALALGLALGSELDVIIYLCARHFGLARFGVLFGSIAGLLSLAAGIGPLIAGAIFDRYKSYDLLLAGVVPLIVAGVLLMAATQPPQKREPPIPLGAADSQPE